MSIYYSTGHVRLFEMLVPERSKINFKNMTGKKDKFQLILKLETLPIRTINHNFSTIK